MARTNGELSLGDGEHERVAQEHGEEMRMAILWLLCAPLVQVPVAHAPLVLR